MASYPHYGTSPASFGRDTSFLMSHHPRGGPAAQHAHRRPSRANDLEAPSELDEDEALSASNVSIAVTDTETDADGDGPSQPTRRHPPRSSFGGSPMTGSVHQSTSALNAGELPASGGMMRGRAFSVTSQTSAFQRVFQDAFSPPRHPISRHIDTSVSTETTPLIAPPPGTIDRPASPETSEPAPFWTEVSRELGILAKYSAPIIGTHVMEYSLLVVTVLSVGHIGTIELAASSLASMTGNVVALSLIIGFAAALDTLCPQAYTSPTPSLTSLFALRTQLLLLVLLVPQFIIFWNAEPILLALRQDPRVAERASQYLRCLSFGLPGYGVFEVARRWLQAQGLMSAPTLCLVIVAPLNAVLNYLLVWGPDPIRLGFIGAPLATMISFNLMGLLCILYCVFIAPRRAWGGLSREIFQDLGPNIRLGLAGFAMVASEWWCWEIVGLASSLLGPTTLAAQSVIVTISSLAYQFPYAVSAAAAVRIGNLLGAGKPRLTRIAFYASLIGAAITSAFNVVIFLAFRTRWGAVFSSEPDVQELVAKVLPLVAAFQVADSTAGITGGVLRGAGKAAIGALFMLLSYYVIGLPVGLALTFSKAQLGLYGLWIGLTVALASVAITCVTYLWNLNYEVQAFRIRQRMGGVLEEGAKVQNGSGSH